MFGNPMVLSREGEERLVVAAQAGDFRAFDQLAKFYRPGIVALARQFVAPDEAQDVAQDALLIAFRALPGLSDPTRFRSWIGAIVRNRALRVISRTRETYVLDEFILAHAPSIRIENEPVTAAMAVLPAEIAPIMEMFYGQGWTAEEVGEMLGLPTTTVKWRLHEGRRLLKQRLGAYFEEEE